MIRNFWILMVIGLSLLASSCKKDVAEGNVETPGGSDAGMEKLIVPTDFNWSVQTDVKLKIGLPADAGSQMHTIEVYNANPFEGGKLLAKGSASATKAFEAAFQVATIAKEIFVLTTNPGRAKTLVAYPVSKQMNIQLGSAPGGMQMQAVMVQTSVSPDCTTDCSATVALTNNGWVTVDNGRTICVRGNNLTFNVTYGTGGGTLRICGTGLSVQNVNNNAGQSNIGIQVTANSSVQFASLNFNNKNQTLTNYGTTTMVNNMAMAGDFTNYGTLITNGDYNINSPNKENAIHLNYGTIRVGSTMNVNAESTMKNEGKIYIQRDLAVNGRGYLENRCLIEVKEVFSNNNLVDNYGYIQVGSRTQLNGNTDYNQYTGAMLLTKDFHHNGRVEGKNGSSLIKTTAETRINGGASVRGFIQYCDQNGVETNNGSFTMGAALGCDLYIAKTDCNTAGNGTPTCPDADNDGVCDADDCFPNDATKAYCNTVPAGTLAFEDNWPWTGDYDMNDLLMEYDYRIITNKDNKVVRVEGNFKLRATGGANQNGFAIEFPVLRGSVTNVTGGTLEAGQPNAVVVLFTNMRNEMRSWNTFRNQALIPEVPYTIAFDVANGPDLSSFGLSMYNPFIWNNGRAGGRGFETHLPGKQPTALANTAIFGTGRDGTVPGTATTYVTKVGRLPWALHIPVRFDYPVEKVDINNAYLRFGAWATSGGTQHPDWYLNLSGNRVESNLFIW